MFYASSRNKLNTTDNDDNLQHYKYSLHFHAAQEATFLRYNWSEESYKGNSLSSVIKLQGFLNSFVLYILSSHSGEYL
jgi:hypothetical protein